MDLIIRNARIASRTDAVLMDIGVERGRIIAIQPKLAATGREMDAAGRLVSPGFVETHIHLDKSRIVDRCSAQEGALDEAIGEVAKAKKAFTPEDVYIRAKQT